MDEVSTGESILWSPKTAERATPAFDATNLSVRSQDPELALRREQWLAAATAITRELLVDAGADPLELIARTVRDVAGALFVTVSLPTHDGRHVMVEVAVGVEDLVGTTYTIDGSLAGRAIETGRAVVHRGSGSGDPPEWDHIPAVANRVGSVVAVPLLGPDGVRGALAVSRPAEGDDFVAVDVEMAIVFANHASMALELADGREQRYRADILEDRARLAGDLHDHVIQRLFAAALRLEMASEDISDDDASAEVSGVVASIRDTIGELRATVTGLRSQTTPTATTTLRRRIERVVDESSVLLPHRARINVAGPLERLTDRVLADDIVAVVREMLSNAGRHAYADRVDLSLTATDDTVVVEVVDDGIGIGRPGRRSGLDSLTRRANRHDGSFTVSDVRPGEQCPGTRVTWTAKVARV